MITSLRAARLLPVCCSVLAATLIAGCGKHKEGGATQVVARVNKAELSVHQINFALQRQPGLKAEQLEPVGRQVLERLIDRELAAQNAVEKGIDRDPSVVMALEEARREVLARAHFERVTDAVAQPTPADIKAFYDSHPALFAQRRLYELQEFIVQADAQQTAALVEHMRSARKLDDATAYLKDKNLPTRVSRSNAAPETLPTAIVDKMAALHDGQALVIPVQGGVRMIFVAQSQSAPLSEEQATPAITRFLMGERRNEATTKDLKSLRTAAKIEYMGKYGEAPPPAAEAASASAGAGKDESVSRGMAGLIK